jgi:hypothetical protein
MVPLDCQGEARQSQATQGLVPRPECESGVSFDGDFCFGGDLKASDLASG